MFAPYRRLPSTARRLTVAAAAVALAAVGGSVALADVSGDPNQDFEFGVTVKSGQTLASAGHLVLQTKAFDVDGQAYLRTPFAATVAFGIRNPAVTYQESLKSFRADTLVVKYVGGIAGEPSTASSVRLSAAERRNLAAAAKRYHASSIFVQVVGVGQPSPGTWSLRHALVNTTLALH